MNFEKKYNLTVKDNIFVAKRNIIDYIWKSAKLEGLGVTFPDTEAIFNGMSVANVKVDDIIAVNNLKRAWRFVIETVEFPTDFNYICHLNGIVVSSLIDNAGFLRTVPVSIGGTSWKPDNPNEFIIKENLVDIFNIESPTERCITLMLYCMRSQMFLDGNKRTSMLVANHEMIRNGCGIISIPVELQPVFTKLLVEFYETNEMSVLKKFVYDNCIDGIDMEAQRRAVEAQKKQANNV